MAGCGEGLRLILDPSAEHRLIERVAEAAAESLEDSGISILIGPEAGLSEIERTILVDAGWEPVALGPRTLWTETAGVVALSTIQAVRGLL